MTLAAIGAGTGPGESNLTVSGVALMRAGFLPHVPVFDVMNILSHTSVNAA